MGFKLDPIMENVQQRRELDQVENTRNFAQNASADQLLPQLQMVVQELKTKFGTWEIPWGDINRFQRLSGDINLDYDDSIASLPISAASSLWGCLPAYKSVYQENTKKRYGNSGNSFVCAVEFGDKVKAKSLLAGEIVVILNQNILMINRKCIKRAIQRRAFLQRCRKTERSTILENKY
jgi:acyl-homoserine lactone acylase PvdQ